MTRVRCCLFDRVALLLLLAFASPAVAQVYDAIMQQALIASLSLERAAAMSPPTATSGPAAADESVPPYMLDLYRKYRSGLALKDGTNAIRCLKSKRGSHLRPDLVFFNVGSIADPASVIKAELHFNKRKTGVLKDQAFQVSFYDVRESPSSADVTSAEMLGFSQISRGWQALDITPAVARSARRAAESYHLGITLTPFGASSYRGEVLPLTKAHSRPYILVYTNESTNITEDQIYARMRARGYGVIQEETKNMIDPVKGLNYRTKEDVEVAKHVFFLRHKRDLYDNEIPGDPDVSRRKAAAAVDAARQQQQQPLPTAQRPKPLQGDKSTTARPKDKGPEQLIPWPRPGKTVGVVGQDGKERCGRRQLVLDFKDIGWDSWIIEPKSFEAGYCSGLCNFPDMLGLNPSNHATLQSLLHAVGIRADVPAPCCVPEKLSSLTVLYFDHKKNVVLKTYPDMSADSCACR